MAKLLSGSEVAAALNARLANDIAALKEKGIIPTLAVVRVGERPDDLSYERSVCKRCETLGIAVRRLTFEAEISQQAFLSAIDRLNRDAEVHGVLIFRPLPKQIDDEAVCRLLDPQKDVDGITDTSMMGVVSGTGRGFAPCTPQACMEILAHFGIALEGKRVTVVGRSLVVGKPVAMMLLKRNATVTLCHTKTADLPAVCRSAEILVVAAGKAGVVGAAHCAPDQVVIDVGINVNEAGKLVGDVRFEEVEPVVAAITPVPGGVGAVTTSVLLSHVVQAAARV